MRRYSLLIAVLALALAAGVGYTLRLRLNQVRATRVSPPPKIRPADEGLAPSGWQWTKYDPAINKTVVRLDARAFEGTRDPSTFLLKGVALRLYDKNAASYTFVKTEQALFHEGSGVLKSQAPVLIVRNVPAAQDANDPKVAARHVRVTTTGVTYETKTGKAVTNDPASFVFPEGDGTAVGVEYDPNTKLLHLKQKVALDWIGKGPVARKMHIETSDLVYKEAESRIYLSPWARLTRGSTQISAGKTVVSLVDGRLHEIVGDHGAGTDTREDRRTAYSADKMTARFDEDGNLVQLLGDGHARVGSRRTGNDTLLTGNRADLRFALDTQVENGRESTDSQLHLVMADGNAVAESAPLPRPHAPPLPETRILRSEHIELEMQPGGKDLHEIRTSTAAELEFKPNRPEQSHRVVNASHLRVLYGADSYVEKMLGWDVSTHTDKPPTPGKTRLGADGKPLPVAPALTWSERMITLFAPASNQVASIDQSGNFRYEEGTRKAWAARALLEQTINRITLTNQARVQDETGSAAADRIVMNQANGDMDAEGHVLSTHEPDHNEKPGTSMLDAAEAMQAQASSMQTRDNNSRVLYQGNVVMWQGANRISAERIAVDRDTESLDASGHVVSELLDNKPNGAGSGPIYAIVEAPRLTYRDDVRIANYTEGVKLTRDKMTISSRSLEAHLNPKDANAPATQAESSLNHAIASGNVVVIDTLAPGHTRTGTGERCEYYTKADKVVLSGGAPQMVDSQKGIIKGQQLTYFSGDEHLFVDGKKNQLVSTRMKKK